MKKNLLFVSLVIILLMFAIEYVLRPEKADAKRSQKTTSFLLG